MTQGLVSAPPPCLTGVEIGRYIILTDAYYQYATIGDAIDADEEWATGLLNGFNGAEAVLMSVPVAEIDENGGSIFPDDLIDYMRLTTTPPPIVIETGRLIDGKHRLEMAKSRRLEMIQAYVVTRRAPSHVSPANLEPPLPVQIGEDGKVRFA